MDYDIGNLMDRVRALEAQVLQLATSPRVGTFRVGSSFTLTGAVASTITQNIWADLTDGLPTVEVTTGRRALVFCTAHPRLFIEDAWEGVALGYRVSGATTISGGNQEGVTDQVREAFVGAGDSSSGISVFSDSPSAMIAFVEQNLNPGLNRFTMQVKLLEESSSGTSPEFVDRGIIVIPLDV